MSYLSGGSATPPISSLSAPGIGSAYGSPGTSPPAGGSGSLGSAGIGSARQRKIVWCPGPRLFGGGDDDHHHHNDSTGDRDREGHGDHDDGHATNISVTDIAEVEESGLDEDASGTARDAFGAVIKRSSGGKNGRDASETKKQSSAGFFIVGLPELKLYEYLGGNNKSPSSAAARLLAIHSDYALLTKSFAWSPSPTSPDLLAIAQGTGKVVLVRLGMFTWLSSGPVGLGGWTGSSGTADGATLGVTLPRPDTPSAGAGAASATAGTAQQPAPAAASSTFSSLTSFLRSSLSSSPATAVNTNTSLSMGPPSKVLAEFSPKHPRACNVVAFSPDGRYLAAGYEKVRNDAGVYVWDLESIKNNSGAGPQSQLAKSLGGGIAPNVTSPFAGAQAQPLGPADPVISLTFLSPHLVVAGVPGKGIRGWDLRQTGGGASPSFAIATKAIYGLAADPWSSYRVAGYGEDGVVRIFDLRKGAVAASNPYPTASSSEPLLALPTADIFPKGVAQLTWSLARSGMLAASGLGAPSVRVWDVREAGGGGFVDKHTDKDGVQSQPVVWRTKTIRSSRSGVVVTGLCFVPPLAAVAPAAEPASPAEQESQSTGHRLLASMSDDSIEILDVREAQRNAWGAKNGNSMAWVGGRGIVCFAEGVRTNEKDGVMVMGSGTVAREDEVPGVLGTDVAVAIRERAKVGYGVEPSDNIDLLEKAPASFGHDGAHLIDLWSFLKTAKELTLSGNAHLGDRDWSFAGVASVIEDGYIAAGGTLPTMLTSRPSISEAAKSAPLGNAAKPTSSRVSSAPGFGALLEQSLREGLEEIAGESAAPEEPASRPAPISEEHKKLALEMCGWHSSHGIAPDLEDLEDVLHTMELRGNFEKAAGWALFRGASLGRAIKSLRSSNEERLKLVAAALSAALPSMAGANGDGVKILGGTQLPPLFVDLCSSLATDLHDPYLRAMFALVANGGDWHVVLDEKELPLRDRVGVAIRFLPDEQLLSYLRRTRNIMVQSGSVEGILLTGLCPSERGSGPSEGMKLLQTYVDQTADVQTAALASAMVVPGRFVDRRAGEWVDAYRSFLDRWEMFHERARFDIARGRYAGGTAWNNVPGIPGTPTLGQTKENKGLDIPPQIAVRCNFCGTSIQHRAKGNRRDFKAIACPSCKKPLPRCALCLMPMGTWPVNLETVNGGAGGPNDRPGIGVSSASSPTSSPAKKDLPVAATPGLQTPIFRGSSIKKPGEAGGPGPTVLTGFDAWFTWCVRCRHGGHNLHVREWFAEHRVCPVSGCGCRCAAL